jgi:hypothetical protein
VYRVHGSLPIERRIRPCPDTCFGNNSTMSRLLNRSGRDRSNKPNSAFSWSAFQYPSLNTSKHRSRSDGLDCGAPSSETEPVAGARVNTTRAVHLHTPAWRRHRKARSTRAVRVTLCDNLQQKPQVKQSPRRRSEPYLCALQSLTTGAGTRSQKARRERLTNDSPYDFPSASRWEGGVEAGRHQSFKRNSELNLLTGANAA